MKNFFLAAALFLCSLLFIPSSAAAYGGGTQAERYPQFVPSSVITVQAQAKIEQLLTDAGETRRYVIELVRAPKDMHVPDGTVTYEVSAPSGLHYRSMTPIYVNVCVDGRAYRKSICYYRIHVYEKIAVAARNLFPGRILSASDVRMEEREITTERAHFLTSPDDVAGYETNKLIQEGIAFKKNMLQKPIIIQCGVPVMIVSHTNGVEVRTEGTAIDRGREGKIIRVRNNSSGKVLRTRVIDARTVEVVL